MILPLLKKVITPTQFLPTNRIRAGAGITIWIYHLKTYKQQLIYLKLPA